MRLERVVLHEVGPFADLDLRFPKKPASAEGKAEIHMFVGPNGSGKSTLLYALAQMFGHEMALLAPRLASPEAFVAIESDDHAMAVIGRDVELPGHIEDLLGRPYTRVRSDGPLEYCDRRSAAQADLTRYRNRASGPLPEPAHFRNVAFVGSGKRPPPAPPSSFAAFAYSGSRSIGSYAIEAIQEPAGDPLEGAVSFTNAADSRKLTQWIANTRAKQALAAMRGDDELARRRADTLARVEGVISEIIERDIAFVLQEEPLAVRMSQGGAEVDLDVLPDGVKSILSWIADILMRLDRVAWRDDTPVVDRPFVLLLDEIEIHLHPAWQRRVLPAVQELFPNAQVFLSTHSPFVVGSVSGARIHRLSLVEGGRATAGKPMASMAGNSYRTVLREVFGVPEEFDVETERLLNEFRELGKRVRAGDEGARAELASCADELRGRSAETRDIVEIELPQLLGCRE